MMEVYKLIYENGHIEYINGIRLEESYSTNYHKVITEDNRHSDEFCLIPTNVSIINVKALTQETKLNDMKKMIATFNQPYDIPNITKGKEYGMIYFNNLKSGEYSESRVINDIGEYYCFIYPSKDIEIKEK